jgi:hypothetical protein
MAKPVPTRARPAPYSPKLPRGERGGKSDSAPRGEEPASPLPWSPRLRAIASVVIVFHMSAVIVAALVAAPPFSPAWIAIADVFRTYINAADLNHGYRFFAPDPGPSHLVDYHLEFADGTTRDGRFPNLDEERPRLLYHRYFMLSEHLNNFYGMWQEALARSNGPLPRAVDRRELVDEAARYKQLYRAFARSYGDELLRRTGAKRVTLKLVEHAIPPPQDVARGQRIDDEKLFQVKDTLGPFGAGGEPEDLP